VGIAILLGLFFQLGFPKRALRLGWAATRAEPAGRTMGLVGLIAGVVAALLQLALLGALILGIPSLF